MEHVVVGQNMWLSGEHEEKIVHLEICIHFFSGTPIMLGIMGYLVTIVMCWLNKNLIGLE